MKTVYVASWKMQCCSEKVQYEEQVEGIQIVGLEAVVIRKREVS